MKELVFCIGFAIGILVNTSFDGYLYVEDGDSISKEYYLGYNQHKLSQQLRYGGERMAETNRGPDKVFQFRDEHVHHDNTSLADKLAKRINIVCFVLTRKDHFRFVPHIRATWGKRCSTLVFLASTGNATLNVIGLNSTESTHSATKSMMAGFQYCYANHYSEADWFLMANEGGFYIMENLRLLLSREEGSKPIYFGHRYTEGNRDSGSLRPGDFVLSRKALSKLVEEGLSGKQYCFEELQGNDAYNNLAKCLEKLGIPAGSSMDILGKSVFNSFNPKMETTNNQQGNLDSVSDRAISFNKLSLGYLYVMEYFMYHLRPYGLTVQPDEKPDGVTI